MYCKKCGTEQKLGQKFCPKCGTPFIILEQNDVNTEDLQNSVRTENETVTPEEMNDDTEKQQTAKAFHKSSDEIFVSSKKPKRSHILGTKQIVGAVCVIAILGIAIWAWNKLSPFTISFSEEEIEGVPFKSSENGKWGMLRPDGTILFEEEFKDEPTVARDGRFYVKNGNGLWEIFSAEEIPQKLGDEYVYLGEFYQGVAPAVKKDEKISLIDKNGEVITILDKSGSKPITEISNFHYGYAVFKADDAAGIVNTKGEILLDARKYCQILHVAPKAFLALDIKYKNEEDRQNIVYDVIDPVGNRNGTIKMAKYNNIVALDDGYLGIEQTSDGELLYGIMDLDGNILVKPSSKTKLIYGYNDGKFFSSNGQFWGVRTVKGEILIREKYDAIRWASSDRIWGISIENGRQEVSLVDLKGNKITRDAYQDASPFFDNKYAFVKITDNTWGMINSKGEELKNVPDIYAVDNKSADNVIISDYVDIDAIASAIKMTPYGFGGFGMNMSPVELLQNYNENCKEDLRIAIDPNTAHIDELAYEKAIHKGVTMKVKLYYSGYLTEKGDYRYDETIDEWIRQPATWTKEPPEYIKITVSGPKLNGKENALYKKLLVNAKTYGEVYKENDHACIIVQKDQNGMVLVNTGSEVWAMVKSIKLAKDENIEQYSLNETRNGSGYENY